MAGVPGVADAACVGQGRAVIINTRREEIILPDSRWTDGERSGWKQAVITTFVDDNPVTPKTIEEAKERTSTRS